MNESRSTVKTLDFGIADVEMEDIRGYSNKFIPLLNLVLRDVLRF
jgi:hypothetical protein